MTTGQKVICVDDKFPPAVNDFYTALPKKDSTYTIRNVSLGISWKNTPGEVCLYLHDIHNPRSSKSPFLERGFNSERFRPLTAEEESAHLVEAIDENLAASL